MAEFEEPTDAALAKARTRSRRLRGPFAASVRYDRRRGRVVVVLTTGLELAFDPRLAQGLETASPEALSRVEVTGVGYGIYFPDLDVDLSLPGLMQGLLGSREWMKRQARAEASRANGRLGGRPRKAIAAE
jgi:hypothetical protein